MIWFGQGHRDPQRQRGFDLFGETLRRRRRWLGWTQRQLEAYSGIDQTVISRLENGKQYGLRWARLADLIDALGGLEVGPNAPDPPGYALAQGGSPRVDLTGGLDPKDDVDAQPGWSASPDPLVEGAGSVAPQFAPAGRPVARARRPAVVDALPGITFGEDWSGSERRPPGALERPSSSTPAMPSTGIRNIEETGAPQIK